MCTDRLGAHGSVRSRTAVVIALALVSAGGAHGTAGAEVVVPVRRAFDGPWLAGTGRLVFGTEDPDRVYRVKEADVGGRRATLASFKFRIRPSALHFDLVRVAAAAGGVMVLHGVPLDPEGENDPQTAARIVVRGGRVEGPLAPLLSCPSGLAGPAPYGAGLASPAADGSLLATVGGECRTDTVGVYRATHGDLVRDVRFDGHVAGVRMAGRWLAAEIRVGYGDAPASPAAAWLVVVDVATGAEALRVDVPGHRYSSGFDVDSDGTLLVGLAPAFAVTRPPGKGCPEVVDMAVASPAAPQLRALPLRACPGVLQLDAGRVLFTHPAGLEVRLALGALSGARTFDVARFRRLAPAGGADLDDRQVAWLERRCSGSVLHLRGVRERATAAAPGPCRVLVTGRQPLRLGRDGALPVRISCPDGCFHAVIHVCHEHHDCGARVPVTLHAHHSTVVRLPLGPRTRAWFRRLQPRNARVRIVTSQNWAAAPTRVFKRAVLPPRRLRAHRARSMGS